MPIRHYSPHIGMCVMSYGFCSTFHTLSLSAKILKIREFKSGNFFETRCSFIMWCLISSARQYFSLCLISLGDVGTPSLNAPLDNKKSPWFIHWWQNTGQSTPDMKWTGLVSHGHEKWQTSPCKNPSDKSPSRRRKSNWP